MWNLQEKRQEGVLESHTSNVRSVAITCDNKFIVSGSRDRNMRIWNLQNKSQEAVLERPCWHCMVCGNHQ